MNKSDCIFSITPTDTKNSSRKIDHSCFVAKKYLFLISSKYSFLLELLIDNLKTCGYLFCGVSIFFLTDFYSVPQKLDKKID